MKNPWLSIPASDYEGHMDLPSVSQLSFLKRVFKKSIAMYDCSSLAYLGCATGNGLEHINKKRTQKVTAIDINPEYLEVLRNRYQIRIPNLTAVEADLDTYEGDGDRYSLIFAALIFEYLDPLRALMKISHWLEDSGVLVVVLQPKDRKVIKVSDTPYASIKLLDPIMNLISEDEFRLMAKESGMNEIECERVSLKSGKTFYIGAYGKIIYRFFLDIERFEKKGGTTMDYRQMTAPCGLDCFNCPFYLYPDDPEAKAQIEQWSREFNVPLEVMKCQGCRNHDGRIPIQLHLFGESHLCAAYECSKEKGHSFCGDCEDFPCDHLHPYADKAGQLPHNTKVFNLCLIHKMGVEKWAETRAAGVRHTYFKKPWTLA